MKSMPKASLSLLLKDRRLWLLALCALLALLFGRVVVPDRLALPMVKWGGYWVMLVGFSLFVFFVWRLLRGEAAARGGASHLIDWPLVWMSLAALLALAVHEPWGFRIVMDEPMLLGTSMGMHFDRQALAPLRGNNIQGAFVLLDGLVDKRPLFFPFLASLVHDVSGYRPSNLFILNGLLSGVLLYLSGVVGRIAAGRTGQVLALCLLAGLPLLAQNVLGGGFEVLNLVMIMATLLLAWRHLSAPSEDSLAALVFSGILLCQTRYESVLFVVPVIGVIACVWLREGRTRLNWAVVASPLLLMLVLLHLRVFALNPSSWELASQPGYTKPFSVSYIPDNLGHTLSFLFAPLHEQPNNLLFSALGCLALPFALLRMLKWLRSSSPMSPYETASVWFHLGLALHFGLMMCYFWGRFDAVVIRRLSLPEHLWLLLAILVVMPELLRSTRLQWGLVGLSIIGYLSLGAPAMARHAYTQDYLPGLETAWRRAFMAEHREADYLAIDNDCTLWVTHQVSCTFMARVNEHPEMLQYHLRNHTFSGIYVFQRIEVNEQTGELSPRKGDELSPAFELETIREQRLQAFSLARLSRIVSIRTGEQTVRAGNVKPVPPPELDPKKKEELRMQYLQNYLMKLP